MSAAQDAAALQQLVRDHAVTSKLHNVPESIVSRIGTALHRDTRHPLGQLAARITEYFQDGRAGAVAEPGQPYTVFNNLSPIVHVRDNFDDLLTPADHVSRRPSDTYYVTPELLLRCHMTAHQPQLLRAGERAFLMIGDVYRRDEIDATHYPVFHQVDGVRIFSPEDLPEAARRDPSAATSFVCEHLQRTLTGLATHLFGGVRTRWVDATFPFTDPSFELEIEFEGAWLEVLGCGMIRRPILSSASRHTEIGWAFGMGLERLAMVLHAIPDIRLFWSTDARFLEQFQSATPAGAPVKFKPYSRMPACYKDVTFWVPHAYHQNDMFELVREVAGDVVERVQLLDQFKHPKMGRESHCYRILYRHMDRTLTNKEVDALQDTVRQRIVSKLHGELR